MRRVIGRAAALVVLCAAVGVVPAAASEERTAPAPRAAADSRGVTLVSGDAVTVTAGDKASVRPGPGREAMPFVTRRDERGHIHVVPADALPLLRAGDLDPRLFDVTTLLEYGYDGRAELPLIVAYASDDERARVGERVAEGGARVTRELPTVDALAVAAQSALLTSFWGTFTVGGPAERRLTVGVDTIWLDGLRQPALAQSVPQVGAPAAWAAGYDGTGVSVAVLDSGIDATHPALAGRVTAQRNFTEENEDDKDRTGHGTHVASTVAGTAGVAPGARLLDGKVCVAGGCAESWILAGMQWAAEQGATVVNLSLGGPDTPGLDPVEEAVGTLTAEHGTLFVVAAGNVPGAGTIASPATADDALSVGAVSKADALASFSSRGPRLDGVIKPDLTAPGVDIVAARGADSGLPGESETTLSGTSMAAPHAAGAAAILAQQHPDWTAARLKGALMTSAHPLTGDVFAEGAGRLDVGRAVAQTLTASPASLSFGRFAWPHADDSPVSRTVSLHNSGTAAVDLAPAVDGPGVFTVSPASVTVPAGGSAEVTVTADGTVDDGEGLLTGHLVAGSLRLPLAVDREVESYDVTVAHLGRDGAAADGYVTVLASADGTIARNLPASTGTVTTRLPRGRYSVLSAITGPDGDGYATTILGQPTLDVAGATTATLDARQGAPISVTVPRTDAAQEFAEVAAVSITPGRTVEVGTLGRTFARLYTAGIGATGAGFVNRVSATYGFDGGAYLLGWLTEDRMPTGFGRTLTAADLATVRADHGHEASGTTGQKMAWPVLPDTVMGGFAYAMPVTLPSARTEFYNVEGRVRWFRSFDEMTADQYVTSTVAPPVAYRAGQSYQEQWSRGVFGPTVASPAYEHQWVTRRGDTLLVLAPLYGDGAGRAGYSSIAAGEITLYRAGVRVASVAELTGEFEVPPEAADYRLEMSAERSGPATLSTRVSVAWTFRSSHVSGDAAARLPLSTVRFAPRVDEQNAAPAGQTVTIPVSVVAQPDSTAGRNTSLTVDVSYDDGVTWARAPVAAGEATVTHPARDGYVSLRATAVDAAGNTVTQTVIRAYKLAA
ncbi:S8 family serine peptidase [Phytohabitans sp. ZYX-F-186]|uniref:S8 family serine peptidase n=1 Tax=Phytohabitans maris TaxID=3071409 RepID=A0ABU0ZCX3_9ACTN|nr:S8 family serine peptidase [Phytohabitans sp. ZYX-F-186]MDQ7904236.1 S8 family serine peptidase [Phytohabitans sp. ZYX-F-186]